MNLFKRMKEDMSIVFTQDPSARSYIEVFLTYSGLHAVWAHRIAHFLHNHRLYFFARVVSQLSRFLTGVEIHPGAQIGRRFFIDHGMGVVIGETCIIGDDVLVYQGVTLGGTGHIEGRRHPTIKDKALIAAGAKVLGAITIGENSKVGAGSVVLKDVPDYSTVVGIPGRVVVRKGKKVPKKLEQHKLPDPVRDDCDRLQHELDNLRKRLAKIEKELNYDNKNI